MASNQTAYYKLNQWLADDAVVRTDFNDDNKKVDTALRALETGKAAAAALTAVETAMAQKANQSALTTLQTTVNTKANQTALSALTTRVGTLESKQSTDIAVLRGENPWAALLNVTVKAESNSVTIPLTAISLADYREIHVLVNFPLAKSISAYLQLNSVSSDYISIRGDDTSSSQALSYFRLGYFSGMGSIRFVLCPVSTTGTSYFLQSLGISSATGSSNVYSGLNRTIAYRNITSLRVYVDSGHSIPVGTQLTIYGLKEFA